MRNAKRAMLAGCVALAVAACAGIAVAQETTPPKPDKAAKAVTLKVGDAAPALAIGDWVQGEPVTGFEKGKVYVVEFWATWCGPCRKSIPHLTKLQAENREAVTIIGI